MAKEWPRILWIPAQNRRREEGRKGRRGEGRKGRRGKQGKKREGGEEDKSRVYVYNLKWKMWSHD